MKLWTIQTEDVYNQVMTTNDYRVDWSKSPLAQYWMEPYMWMKEQAVKRGLKDNGKGLIWSWYKWYTAGRDMDLRALSHDYREGEKYCCMTLEVPDDQVLLIDTENWIRRINCARCYPSGVEEVPELYERLMDEYYDEKDKEKSRRIAEDSWHLVFDFNPGFSEDVEGIFFGLDREMVQDMQFFVGTYKPDY